MVNAVKATGKKTLIISGMWTSVCVVYPALSAMGEGYTVYADASRDITPEAHNLAMLRLTQAGAIYTRVCKHSKREEYLSNCPDPNGILRMNQYISN